MTDNLARLTAAPDLSLVTVDGVITETTGYSPRRLVLTDETGSIDATVPIGCVGGRTANDTTQLVGTYAVIAGRREDTGHVLASVVRLAARDAAGDLLVPATFSDLSENVAQLLSTTTGTTRRALPPGPRRAN
ncbi:hypothetical protein [Kitasatospora griseola]|uniref:hypothetical protein n=1 Tax=Kitasatospora griseola TaxID=2064 RepID=UPI00167173BE|nr:hypothetical protein [Kitasatospora griseola]GGR04424.1 hypothetical protein GCM10010195_69890 [Kitasatospora griseola]